MIGYNKEILLLSLSSNSRDCNIVPRGKGTAANHQDKERGTLMTMMGIICVGRKGNEVKGRQRQRLPKES